ncbi:hypothetical protein D3C81_1740480 [compost metagenome]
MRVQNRCSAAAPTPGARWRSTPACHCPTTATVPAIAPGWPGFAPRGWTAGRYPTPRPKAGGRWGCRNAASPMAHRSAVAGRYAGYRPRRPAPKPRRRCPGKHRQGRRSPSAGLGGWSAPADGRQPGSVGGQRSTTQNHARSPGAGLPVRHRARRGHPGSGSPAPPVLRHTAG